MKEIIIDCDAGQDDTLAILMALGFTNLCVKGITVVAGFAADIGDNTTLKLEYSGNYRKEYLDHSGMLRLEWRF